ncbi:MAG: hypothetical protein H6550_02360 [Chitinophagales bacterium]|nr:hypothetical protein [Chitinophagales bacterium]
MKKYASLLFITVCLSSCFNFYIAINDTDYYYLKDEQRAELRQFGDPYIPDSNGHYLVEITAKDVCASILEHTYTWLHHWVPYCSGENCKPLFYYNNIIKTQEQKEDIQMFLISNSYEYKTVKKQVKNFDRDVYVLKNDRYGHKVGKNSKAFAKEMHDAGYFDVPTFWSDMIFKGDSLIYKGNLISNAIVDSVIAANM